MPPLYSIDTTRPRLPLEIPIALQKDGPTQIRTGVPRTRISYAAPTPWDLSLFYLHQLLTPLLLLNYHLFLLTNLFLFDLMLAHPSIGIASGGETLPLFIFVFYLSPTSIAPFSSL